MKHLDTLKLLDKILGILYIIGAVIALLAAIWPLIFIGSGEVSAIIVAVVGAGFAALSLLVIGILHIKAGGMILQGRGRILQTVLAVLNVGNFPLGTAFAIYAFWVCWMNDETKNHFS